MLARNVAFNLLGLGVPLLAAVASIPILISELGAERFGALTLIWAIVSYFGLFDLGLGRALTQQLAIADAAGNEKASSALIGTSLPIMLALGCFAGLLLYAGAGVGESLVAIKSGHAEVRGAMYAMAFAMPSIILTAAFRGILEAKQAFRLLNVIRIPLGVYTFVAPMALAVYIGPRLDWIAWALAVGRIVACLIHGWYAWHALRLPARSYVFAREWVRPLCSSGGWLTLSNVVSPFMGYVDRFMIGSMISVATVSYYVTPQELVTKLWIIPGALTTVLFPQFAAMSLHGPHGAWEKMTSSVAWTFCLLLPIVVTLVVFAEELLTIWVSPEFSLHSSDILQVSAIGILVNCLAHIPLTLLQGYNRAKLTAQIQVAELLPFLIALYIGITYFGIYGALAAWLLRMTADSLIVFAAAVNTCNVDIRRMLSTKVVIWIAVFVVLYHYSGKLGATPRCAFVALSLLPLTIKIWKHWSKAAPIAGRIGLAE